MTTDTDTVIGEWRRGWRVVVAAALGTGMASLQAVTLGAMVQPLQSEMGWGRAEITGGLAIGSVGTILLTPLVGRIVDRIGARRFVLTGIWFYALGLAGLGLAGPGIGSWFAMWGFLAFACMGASPVAWTIAVASRFEKGRGFALAVTLAGLNIAAMAAPLLAVMLIGLVGWRLTYAVLGLGCIMLILPIAYAWFYDAKDLVRAERMPAADAGHIAASAGGYAFKEAIRQGSFWRLLLSLSLVGGGVSALTIHFQPLLTDAGLSREYAALMVGMLGPVSFVSRLGTGYLLDRVHAPLIAAPMFALPIISCLLLRGYNGDPAIAMVCAVLNGFTIGAEIDLIAFLVSRYCGMRSFGLLYGIAFSAFTIGYGAMPVIAGRWFDKTGNYDGILIVIAALLMTSAILAGSLGRYPDFSRRKHQAHPG